MSDKKYHRDRKVRDSRHEEDPRYKETYRRDSDMQSVRSSSCLSDDLCSPEYSSRSSSRRYDDLDVLSSRHSRQVAASLRSSRELDDDLYDAVGLGGCTRRRDSDVPLGQSRLSSDDLDGLGYPSGSSSLRHQLRSLEYSRERSHPDSASYRIHSTRSLSPLSDNRPPVDDSRILEYRGDKRVDHQSANSSRSFDDHIMEMEYSHSLIDSHNKSSERDLFSPSRKYRDGSPSEKYRDSSSSRKYRESSSPRKYRDSSPSERYRDISPSRKYRESSSPRKYRDSSSPRRYRDSSPSERYPDRREYEENRRKLHYDENERTRVKPYDLTERRRAVRSGSFSPPLKKRVPDDVDCRQPDGRHDDQNSDRRVLYERGDEYSELDSNKERLLPDDYRKREEINLLKAKIKQMQEEKSLGGLRSDLDIAALAEALQPALMEEIANIEAMEQKANNTHTLKMMERETADVDPVRFEASARHKLISQPALRTMERDERNNDSLSRNELQPDLRYELISEFGESSNKMYTVQVTVDDRAFFGTGSTIQRAKREARKKALLEIVNLTSPGPMSEEEDSPEKRSWREEKTKKKEDKGDGSQAGKDSNGVGTSHSEVICQPGKGSTGGGIPYSEALIKSSETFRVLPEPQFQRICDDILMGVIPPRRAVSLLEGLSSQRMLINPRQLFGALFHRHNFLPSHLTDDLIRRQHKLALELNHTQWINEARYEGKFVVSPQWAHEYHPHVNTSYCRQMATKTWDSKRSTKRGCSSKTRVSSMQRDSRPTNRGRETERSAPACLGRELNSSTSCGRETQRDAQSRKRPAWASVEMTDKKIKYSQCQLCPLSAHNLKGHLTTSHLPPSLWQFTARAAEGPRPTPEERASALREIKRRIPGCGSLEDLARKVLGNCFTEGALAGPELTMDMVALCRHMSWEVPEQFTFYPKANSPACLLHWRALHNALLQLPIQERRELEVQYQEERNAWHSQYKPESVCKAKPQSASKAMETGKQCQA